MNFVNVLGYGACPIAALSFWLQYKGDKGKVGPGGVAEPKGISH